MVFSVSTPETALQLPTSVLKTPVWLNDSYIHEQFEISLCMLLDGINHQSVFVIAQLPVLACLHQFPIQRLIEISKSQQRSLKAGFLESLKCTHCIFCECHLLILFADSFPRKIFMQWLCNVSKPFNKLPVMSS